MNNLTKLLSVLLFVSLLLGFQSLVIADQTKPDQKENQKENPQEQVNGVKPERVKPVKPERVKPVKQVKPERPVRVQNPSHYNGVITKVTDNKVTISLKKEVKPARNTNSPATLVKDQKPTTKTFTLDSKSQINKDLNKINPTDLKVGDIVNINLERIGKEDFRVRSVKVITAETQNIIQKIQIKTKDKEVKL